MSERSTQVKLNNSTDIELVRNHANLDSGEWTDSQLPPETIKPNSSGTWQSESDGAATGTEGTVAYDFVGGGQLQIHWSNPYVGDNSYSTNQPGGYQLSHDDAGKGNHASTTFTLRKL